MKRYFNMFPRIEYPIPGSNKKISTIDLSIRHIISDELKNTPSAYYNYIVKEGERPDQIAKKYYKDANLSWLVMLSSDIFDWGYDMPMAADTFEKYLENKYQKKIDELTREIYHYEDGDGSIVDAKTYASSRLPGKRAISVYQFELEENEKRANIKLISKVHVNRIISELSKRMDAIETSRRLAEEYNE